MKKILVMSALVAISAAFVACSSDDDLVQTPVVKGTPVKVVLGGTRADLSKTTTANLSSFQLYGVQQTAVKNFWMDNVKFTKNGSDWESSATWPVANKETVSKFYGFSDGVTDGTPLGVTPSIAADAQSFTFTFGDGVESSPYVATVSPKVLSTMPSFASAGFVAQREASKATADVLESNKLTDLLVTYDDTEGVEGTDGTLNLNFKHAFSNLILKAYFVGDEAETTWPSTSVFYIEWIRIYGLYTSGTYTFGSGWSFGSSEKKVIYEKIFGEEESETVDNRFKMSIQTYADYQANGIHYEPLVDEGEFMAIPQDYSARAYSGQGTAISDATGQCYIELHGYFQLNPSADAQGKGEKTYLTLDIKNQQILPGKKQTVFINLTKLLKDNGTYFLTPSTVVGG